MTIINGTRLKYVKHKYVVLGLKSGLYDLADHEKPHQKSIQWPAPSLEACVEQGVVVARPPTKKWTKEDRMRRQVEYNCDPRSEAYWCT